VKHPKVVPFPGIIIRFGAQPYGQLVALAQDAAIGVICDEIDGGIRRRMLE
jgi:hypothetical protein